jgi:hypothetical protein
VQLELRRHSVEDLPSYAGIPSALRVTRILDVTVQSGGLGGCTLSERPIDAPYIKDYDQLERPADWVQRFDLSSWALFGAWVDGRRLGGAAVRFGAPNAVLWDIRVASGSPTARRRLSAFSSGLRVRDRSRVSPSHGGNAERERPRLPVLCPAGLRAGCDPSIRVSDAARRSPDDLVPGSSRPTKRRLTQKPWLTTSPASISASLAACSVSCGTSTVAPGSWQITITPVIQSRSSRLLDSNSGR